MIPIDVICLIFDLTDIQTIIRFCSVNRLLNDIKPHIFTYRVAKPTSKIVDNQLVLFRFAKVIDLQLCRQITDDGLQYLSSVEILNLRGCYKITDFGLSHLGLVKEINLSGCFKINSQGLSMLKSATYIDISWTMIKEYCRLGTTIIYDDNLITGEVYNTYLTNHSNKTNFENNTIKYRDNGNNFIERIICSDPTIKRKFPSKYIIPFELVTFEMCSYYTGLSNKKNAAYMLYRRQKLFYQIYDNKFEVLNCDHLLASYTKLLPNLLFISKSKAIGRLHAINPYMRSFLSKLREFKLDALIAGSTGLYCVYSSATFIPDDIDIYIRNLTPTHIYLLEDIIYQSFPIANIVVCRGSLTMTWFIQVNSGKIYKIQLNLFSVASWAQIFLVYHTDLVCIGYEVLTNEFIYLVGRFEAIVTKSVHYFSNLFNFDSGSSLERACLKYINRGFNCQVISFMPTNEINKLNERLDRKSKDKDIGLIEGLVSKYYGDSIYIASGDSKRDTRMDLNYLPHILAEKFGDSAYVMAPSVLHLCFESEIMVQMIYLSVFMIDRYPDRLQYLNIDHASQSFNLPKKINNCVDSNYFIGVKYECESTYISLRNWSFHDRKKCKHKKYCCLNSNFNNFSIKPDMLII